MEINGFGMINTDDYRLSASRSLHKPNDFSALFERMKSSDNLKSSEHNSAPSINKNGIDTNDKLYELCLELETFLVKNLLTSMRNTIQKTGLVDEGFAGKMYEDMLYEEYAKDFTKNANFGLAEQAYRQLKSLA